MKQKEKFSLTLLVFFKGDELEYAINIVEQAHGFDPGYGIEVLINKCLINIHENGVYIEMHDLIQDMGREIVHQELPNEPGKRSRLWSLQDIVDILAKKKK